ncbi:MAG: hypothetical protein M3R68_11435, partial [Acidobacteriota bacterium]|nr:hypothetical protein [Acidobacteriota bacterium]
MSAAAGMAVVIAIAEAIKASGVVVRVEPEDFLKILGKAENPLVIYSESGGGIFSKKYQYLTSYKGFAFFVKTMQPILFTSEIEMVRAGKIWIPG